MIDTATWPNEQVQIPDLLRRVPQARPVLDRYGLRGCGGEEGPAESLGFFARAHDVPVDRLLEELRGQITRPAPPAPAVTEASPADSIYRPFFKAGILVVLSLGAVWGAYLLLRIGLGGSFTAAGLHEVNAHGHAQIFGWVGLFVMGFAYQAFPRFKHVSLAYPHFAFASLGFMLVGLGARSLLQPLAASYPVLVPVAVGASALEVVAVGLFLWVIAATWRSAGRPLAVYDHYIAAALLWFAVQAVCEGVYLTATLTATGPALINLVATWQAPLRDIQIHGFALLIILGVSQRLFHPMYGLPAPSTRRAGIALGLLNVALVGEVLGLILMRQHGRAWAGLWLTSVLLLTGTVLWLVRDWRLFSRATDADRSLKFLRIAYVWLFVSLAMLTLLPVYQFGLLRLLAPESVASQLGFSHAYYGATRHAITVGFVSLMIVGVAAKVVPTLNGIDTRRLPALWIPFLLLNGGCTLRVLGQIWTDFTPVAFPIAGVSGILEVAGLTIWGIHLWRLMPLPRNARPAPSSADAVPLEPGRPIRADHRVGQVLDQYPNLLSIFVGFGFHPLRSAVLRSTLARHVTLQGACRLAGVDPKALLAALNAVVLGDSRTDECRTDEEQECLSRTAKDRCCHLTTGEASK